MTSFPKAAVLYVYSYTQRSMRLHITAALTLVTATEWLLIGFIRH